VRLSGRPCRRRLCPAKKTWAELSTSFGARAIMITPWKEELTKRRYELLAHSNKVLSLGGAILVETDPLRDSGPGFEHRALASLAGS
jgi:hypothetical protein